MGQQYPRVFGCVLAFFVFLLDQGSKLWVLKAVSEDIPLRITAFLDFILVWNRGVSYGWFAQDHLRGQIVLIVLGGVCVLLLWVWMWRCPQYGKSLALGLVIGGALGNMLDRMVHGAVVDFISLHAFGWHWYVFNLADCAIVLGVCVIVIEGWFGKNSEPFMGGKNA